MLQLRQLINGLFYAPFRILISQIAKNESSQPLDVRDGNLVGPELPENELQVRKQISLAQQVGGCEEALFGTFIPDHGDDFPEFPRKLVAPIFPVVRAENWPGEDGDLQIVRPCVIQNVVLEIVPILLIEVLVLWACSRPSGLKVLACPEAMISSI